MACQPYDPATDLRDCLLARYVPLESITNADMDGIIIGVAAVVITLCSQIQIVWSPAHIDGAVTAYLIQVYSVFLSTLFSIGRQQLSLFDANHALLVTSSPLTVELAFASICHLFGFESYIFKRIQSNRTTIGTLGALLLPLWFGLNVTTLSSSAFIDSKLCSGPTFKDLVSKDATILDPVFAFTFTFLVTLLTSLNFFLTLPDPTRVLRYAFFILITSFVPLHFYTIFTALSPLPSWVLDFIIGILLTWTALIGALVASGIDIFYWLHSSHLYAALYFCWATGVVANALHASGSKYVASYGQLFALPAAVYSFMSIAKLGYARLRGPSGFFRHLPGRVGYAVRWNNKETALYRPENDHSSTYSPSSSRPRNTADDHR